jgi:hypothetical protein
MFAMDEESMRAEGLEPPWACAHRLLRPARLTRFRHARGHLRFYERRGASGPHDSDAMLKVCWLERESG